MDQFVQKVFELIIEVQWTELVPDQHLPLFIPLKPLVNGHQQRQSLGV